MNNSFSHTDNMFLQSHLISPVLNDTLSISPELRYRINHTFFFIIILIKIKSPHRLSELSSMRDDPAGDNFFENGLFSHQQHQHNSNSSGNGGSAICSGLGSSAHHHASANAAKNYSMSPALMDNLSLNEINRLRGELAIQSANKTHWEDRIMLASKACEAWRTEADASNRKVSHFVS